MVYRTLLVIKYKRYEKVFAFIFGVLLLTGCQENKFQEAAQKEIENCESVFKRQQTEEIMKRQ